MVPAVLGLVAIVAIVTVDAEDVIGVVGGGIAMNISPSFARLDSGNKACNADVSSCIVTIFRFASIIVIIRFNPA